MAVKQIGAAPSGAQDASTKGYADRGATFGPIDNNSVAWTGDPRGTTTALFATGRIHYFQAKMAVTSVITNVNVFCNVAGATVTAGYFGIYTFDGQTQLGITANQTTSLQSVGIKTIPLAVPTISIAAGTKFLVVYLAAATTMPSLTAWPSSVGTNLLLVPPATVMQSQGTATGVTVLPASLTMSAFTAGGNGLFAILS
jgi:hypothetical protein